MKIEVDRYKNTEVSNYGNFLDSWFEEYNKKHKNFHKQSEQSISLINSSKQENINESSLINYKYNELNVYINSDRSLSSYEFTETIKDGVNLAFDGNNKQTVDELPSDSRTEIKNLSKTPMSEDRISHQEKTVLRLGSKESAGTEGAGKDDSKGKPANTSQQIKGCMCQELTPEQKEQNVHPPPCNCKMEKLKKKREKIKECPECDRIKLNANLIRAIQRINELQAQRKLTESDVKLILEEEYHGDIFGFRDDKLKVPIVDRKIAEEQPQKTIPEREQEMRKEFKEIIENEVTKFEERKKKKAAVPKVCASKDLQKTEQEKPKKKKKAKKIPLEMEEILKWMYPGHHFGHKHCLPPYRLVPKTMGWLWNSSNAAGICKPGRGWVPGSIRKDVIDVMKQLGKEKRGIVDTEEERTMARSSQRSGTSKSRENLKGYTERYNPTFHMHKKGGYYYFSLYPVKTDELEKIGQDPKPTMFKISAKQPDPDGSEVSTDDESYEIEFVTPSAMKKQIKKPVKKNISQQYLDEDISIKLRKSPIPEKETKPEKSAKKGKGKKKKGNKKKGKK